jgi:hypothetical protein
MFIISIICYNLKIVKINETFGFSYNRIVIKLQRKYKSLNLNNKLNINFDMTE